MTPFSRFGFSNLARNIAAISPSTREAADGSLRVRHSPQSGWLDERGRLKGGHSGSSVVALWRAGRKAAGKALRPPPVCVVQGTTAYRRPTAPAVTFALFNRDWRGCDKGFQGNGQTSSSLTGRTSGLPFVQLTDKGASLVASPIGSGRFIGLGQSPRLVRASPENY